MQFKSIIVALATASNAVNALAIPEGTALEPRDDRVDGLPVATVRGNAKSPRPHFKRYKGVALSAALSARSPAPEPQNNGGDGGKGGDGKGKGGGGGNDCKAARDLAKGIQKNIKDQEGELKTANEIREIVGRNTVNEQEFKTAKEKLLGFVKAGITQREENQKKAPKGNAAIPGLEEVQSFFFLCQGFGREEREFWLNKRKEKKKLTKLAPANKQVAKAQKQELEQAEGLKGNSQDLATLIKMKKEFEDGIKLNEQNKKDVSIIWFALSNVCLRDGSELTINSKPQAVKGCKK